MCESMIERVARAAYEKFIEDVRDLEPSWEGLPQSHRDRMIVSQRAAIEEMREPTGEMEDAGNKALSDNGVDNVEGDDSIVAWKSMIDTALNEQVAG